MRDIKWCEEEKKEKARVKGLLYFLVSVRLKSVISLENLMVEVPGCCCGVHWSLSKLGFKVVLKSPIHTAELSDGGPYCK